MIRLYKIIIYDEKLSIEFIQDIKLFDKDFEGFNGPISCIINSIKKRWEFINHLLGWKCLFS